MTCTDTDNHVNVKSTIKKGKKKTGQKTDRWFHGFMDNSLEIPWNYYLMSADPQNLSKISKKSA